MSEQTKLVTLRSEAFVSDYVLSFHERHLLGEPARLVISALLEEEVPLSKLVGSRAQLRLESQAGTPRTFWGVIESAELVGSILRPAMPPNRPTYNFQVVSQLALLEHSIDSRIYQDLSVDKIITQVLELHGIPADQIEWKLNATYPKREYCTQYQESALNFISRLAESEGIFFHSVLDPEASVEKLIFSDSSADAAPELSLPLRHPSQLMGAQSAVYSVRKAHRVASGKVTLNAFDFKRPTLDLLQEATAETLSELEHYDFSDNYFEPGEGKRLAQVRLEAEQAKRCRLSIEADEPGLHVGQKLTITAPTGENAYFVVGVTHEYNRAGELGVDASRAPSNGSSSKSYSVSAQLIPIDVPFRLDTLHRAPLIHGPQTATVVATEGAEMEEIFCDEHARCKVKFHWDRSDEFFGQASCWMRVTQLQTSGSMILPRVHWEVMVEFLEGNPDRPMVTGRLFNGTFMPPYELPAGKTRTSIQTSSTPAGGGTNEIRFEDKAGAEEVMIHSQYNTVIAAANNRDKTVGTNETLVVGNNASMNVGSNSDTKITYGYSQTVGANQDVSVGVNRSVEVNAVYGLTAGGNATTTVGANQKVTVGDPLDAVISLAAAKAAELATAKAAEAMGQLEGQVQGAIGKAIGPINTLVTKANAITGSMVALTQGGLSAAAPGLMAGVSALPTPASLAKSLTAAATTQAVGADASAAGISLSNAIWAAAGRAAGQGLATARSKLGASQGQDASGAGGQSVKNRGGPDGAVSGLAEEDLDAGPGYAQYKVSGNHSETIGALGVTAAVNSILTNVSGNMTQTVGAAHLEVVMENRAESVEGSKTETCAGLVAISDSDESEEVGLARSALIGAAKMETIKGDRTIESKSMISLVGAMHKVEAKTKLTFKCGASTVVVDGAGVTVQSPLVNVAAATIQMTKDVHNG